MNAATLAALLADLYRERRALVDRHVAGARYVSSYEFNNTYQYVIAREEVHLDWLRRALEGLDAPVPADAPSLPVPEGGAGATRERAVIADDARLLADFLARWTPRVRDITHARHARMVEVILGETREHLRFFEQMLEGREDVLGRRMAGASTGGGVLPTRWVE